MSDPHIATSPQITISSLAALLAAEQEILRRLSRDALVSQMFLFDPVQALADVGIALTPTAIREWEEVVPALRQRDGVQGGHHYARMKAAGGVAGLKVAVRGLVAPPSVNASETEAEVARDFPDRA